MIKFSFRRSALAMVAGIAIPAISGMTAASAATQASSHPIRLPSSCQEIHNLDHHARNGNYTLYDNGYIITVYCDGMRRGTPEAYISLAETRANENYSQYTAGGASPGTNVRTTFTKLRIDPATMTVDIGNLTFASSTGSLNHSGDGVIVTSMPYGVAESCEAPGSTSGTGNIDLQGTPYAVDDTFSVGGYLAAGSAAVSANRQVVNLKGGGYCGAITPSPWLYNDLNPKPGIFHLKLSCASKPVYPGRHERAVCIHIG
jgi:hypothetical protein